MQVNPESILSRIVPPATLPDELLKEEKSLRGEIAGLEVRLSEVTAVSQRVMAQAIQTAIEKSVEAICRDFFIPDTHQLREQIDPQEYRALMQVAGLVTPKLAVDAEVQQAANLAIDRLLECASFQSGFILEKNLAILDGRWIGSTNQELDAYRYAIKHNSDPVVAKFLWEQFLNASSYNKAGCLAQCLSGTQNPEVIANVFRLLQDSITAVDKNLVNTKLTFQHLLAPIILKGTSEEKGIDLLVRALRLDSKILTDRFYGLAVVHGQPAEQYLKFVARSLTPSMGNRVQNVILKTMLDPELPNMVRRSLFVNCLIDPFSDYQKLESALGFMKRKLPRRIQAAYLRVCRTSGDGAGEKIKGLGGATWSVIAGPSVTKEYLNQIRTIAIFLVGTRPPSGLFALERHGLDYNLYNRAQKVLSGHTGREEFFTL